MSSPISGWLLNKGPTINAPYKVGATGADSGGSGFGSAMGGFSLGTSIGSAIGSVIGAYMTGRGLDAQVDAHKYALEVQAHINENNANLARMAASNAMRAGDQQIGAITAKAGKIKSTQKTRMAANGIRVGVGSSAEVLASTDIEKELDVRTAKINALNAAFGYSNAAATSMNNAYANLAAAKGSEAVKGFGMANAGVTLLDHAGTVADKWYKYYGD